MADVNLKVYQSIDPEFCITEAQITKQKEEERKAQAKVVEAEDREMSSGVCVVLFFHGKSLPVIAVCNSIYLL